MFGIAAFLFGFRQARPHLSFALAGTAFGFSAACKWSGLFPLATCIAVVAAIRLMQGWRTQFADARETDWYRPGLWPDFRARHFALCFMLLPAAAYLSSFVALYGFSISDLLEAQRRIFSDNTTTAIAGHTYMSSWPSWPFLVRPVWFLFDNLGNGTHFGGGVPRQSAGAVAGAARHSRSAPATSSWRGAPMPSWCWRSISGPVSPGRCCRAPSAFIYYYLPSATTASLALVYALRREGMPRWLLWAFVAVAALGFAAMLPVSAAFIGTSMQTFSRLMIFQNWI